MAQSIQIRGGTRPENEETTMNISTHDTDTIGGGAINEKERKPSSKTPTPPSKGSSYTPDTNLSHCLHSLVGLDRYPNYLTRWSSNIDDISSLEKSLERSLTEIRRQKRWMLERREGMTDLLSRVSQTDDIIKKLWSPRELSWGDLENVLDRKCFKAMMQSKFFRAGAVGPEFKDVMSGEVDVDLDVSLLEGLIDQEMFDVYSFPIFSETFCQEILYYIQTVVSITENESQYSHIALGKRPVDLDTIGLGWINDLLFHLFVKPISKHLFQQTEIHGKLDWRQGFVAGYSSTPSSQKGATRSHLISHTDDSEVTLNICLGCKFQGGALQFYGLRGSWEEASGKMIGEEFQPVPGTALVHAGRHLHLVTDVTEGDRYVLILWARSWSGVRSVTCPCCWLNRRTDENCICGSRWN